MRRLQPRRRWGAFFFTPDEVPSLCALLKEAFPEQAKHIISRAERICQHHFDLLGYENLNYGAQIDWHSDVVHANARPASPWFKVNYLDFGEAGDSKITWELNRHQHFIVLAKAYCLSGDDKFAREIFAQWVALAQRKIRIRSGLNWASSLEVAYRRSGLDVDFLLTRAMSAFHQRITEPVD